jgi:hypothetical protein
MPGNAVIRTQKNPDRHEWVRAEAIAPLFSDFLRGRKPVDKSHDAQTIRPVFPYVKHHSLRFFAHVAKQSGATMHNLPSRNGEGSS